MEKNYKVYVSQGECLYLADKNECENNPCKNGGTCTNKIGGYSCTCTAEWTGTNCEQGEHFFAKRLRALYQNIGQKFETLDNVNSISQLTDIPKFECDYIYNKS